ncbi:MAG: PH domain-containing protein [Eubacteriales bacterium]|nr:PH domain-containing protein [Eubacteriales bacterium]
MTPSQLGILAGAALVLLLAIRSSLQKRQERKERDFTRTLETALLPKETVKVICPQKKGRYILTNKRLILEEKGSFHAIPFDKIKSIQGKNAAGNRTTSPANMVSLTIKADKDITIQNSNDQFPELTKLLQSELKKRKEKAEK